MNIYEEYATNRKLINELTEKTKVLELQILEEIKNVSTTMVTDKGSFSKVVRKSYVFSDKYNELQKKASEEIKAFSDKKYKPLEKIKEEEIQKGIAKVEESIGLRYTPKKEGSK